MSRRALMLSSMALVVFVSCGDDDESPTESGTPQALTGTVMDLFYPGVPVPGIPVASGAVSAVSGADGSFSLPGVTAPYDLLAAVAVPGGGGSIYTGYVDGTDASPSVGALPIGFNNPRSGAGAEALSPALRDYSNDQAELEGTISNADGAGESIFVVVSDGERAARSEIVNPATPTYSNLEFQWPSAPSHVVSVAAIQIDAAGGFSIGRVDGVTLGRATTNNVVNLALNAVAGGAGEIPVSASPPGALAFSSVVWQAFVVVDGLPYRADRITTDSGSLRVPVIPNAQYLVALRAALEDGGDAAGTYSKLVHDAEVGVAINEAVTLQGSTSTPADGATGVSRAPTFEWTAPPSAAMALLNVFGDDVYGSAFQQWLLIVPTDATSAALPANELLGAGLHPSGAYAWTMLWLIDGDAPAGADVLRTVGVISEPGTDIPLATSATRTLFSTPSHAFETISD